MLLNEGYRSRAYTIFSVTSFLNRTCMCRPIGMLRCGSGVWGGGLAYPLLFTDKKVKRRARTCSKRTARSPRLPSETPAQAPTSHHPHFQNHEFDRPWKSQLKEANSTTNANIIVVCLQVDVLPEQVQIPSNAHMGWTFEATTIPISYDFQEGYQLYFRAVNNRVFPRLGQNYTFEILPYPAVYSVSVEIDTRT